MANIDLAGMLEKELSLYADDVAAKVKNVCKNKAKQLAENIKNSSPKKTGNYAKGWTSKIENEDSVSASYVVYNSKKPQLTHLLEDGFATRDGGRVEGTAHIKPNEEKTEEELQSEIKEVLSQ